MRTATPTTIEQARQMGWKPITAKFAGTCKRCNGHVCEGEAIFWKKGVGTVHGSKLACEEHGYVFPDETVDAQLVAALAQMDEQQQRDLGSELGGLIRYASELAEKRGLAWEAFSPAVMLCNEQGKQFAIRAANGVAMDQAWLDAADTLADRYETLAA